MKQYFQAASKQMMAETQGIVQALRHPGMKGDAGEEALRTFLRKYLPKRYNVGQGKVVDFTGRESKQTDIIIADAASTVPLYVDAVNMIVPIESVYAVVEVKTSLTSQSLSDGIANLLSFHELELPSRHEFVRGGVVAARSVLESRPKGMIVGLNPETSLPIRKLAGRYLKYVRSNKISFPVVSCCTVLGNGYFFDVPGRKHARWRSEVYVSDNTGDDTLLMFFLTLLGMMDSMPDRTRCPFSLYLNAFVHPGRFAYVVDEEAGPLPLGDRLRATRRAVSLTQQGLARLLDIDRLDVHLYETKMHEPEGEVLAKIEQFLKDHDLVEEERSD